MRWRVVAAAAISVGLGTWPLTGASPTVITVAAGGDLQAAINAAQDGDTIVLAPGAVYVGNFVLPNKAGVTHAITIRSGAPDAALPPDGVRMTPAYAAQLPKLRSGNSGAALRTAVGAHHWVLRFLEFQANQNGYGDIIDLGAADATQTDLSQVPTELVLDRLYVHGDPIMGQKRGIGLNSSHTQILNSWIADCKAVGQDAQAIAGWNGPGSYVIENNYIEGAGENFLIGGSDPNIPNLVTTNVVFRHNYLTKPVAWRGAIVAAPSGVTAVAAPAAGTLAPGTYSYTIVARMPAGQTTMAASQPSAEVSATVRSSGSAVALTWSPVAGATGYYVYGRSAGAENVYWSTSAAAFTDTGAAGTAGTPGSASRWTTKNVFELKNAQDVVVQGNVIEHIWVGDQPGYPVVFTPRNQNGTASWTVVQRITFSENIVRHTAGAVNVLGTDNVNPSQLTNHIVIADNVFDDISATWGSGAKVFQIGAGPDQVTIDHNTVISNDSTIVSVYGGSTTAPTPVTGFVYTNNMSAHNSYGILGANYAIGTSTIAAYFPNGIIDRNVLAGGSAAKYPADNFFPTVASWQGSFVNFAAGDYHLLAGSAFSGAATDGTDLGASIDTVNQHAAIALSGDTRAPVGTPSPPMPAPPRRLRIVPQ